MGIQHEKAFEDEIVDHLGANGWRVSPTDHEPDAPYDRARAIVPADILAWLHATQREELEKVVKPDLAGAARDKAVQQLLDRIVKRLETPAEAGGGTLNMLRRGFKTGAAAFRMCAFKPATTLNAAATADYERVILRVMRQVRYSQKGTQSIDLVCFVNGLPVATLELKTDNMQTIDDAIAQYRNDRDPKGEPLLAFTRGALVHFAVSNAEARMTTKLEGRSTRFLPFNRGNAGRSGNPAVPGKSSTSYLWEQILERHAWLHIIGSLLHLETRKNTDPITGAVTMSTTLLFPRYHQWDAVTKLLDAARTEGSGHRYLIQHSAGSGKTNSIAWLAHGLSQLFDERNEKVFDSVIVVTDRTVLDEQLQKAISQIQGVDGVVATISPDAIRRLGDDQVTSKSKLLAKELGSGRLVIVVTIQTFPFALEAIRTNTSLAARRFAIIADEAHSSQTGAAAQKLRLGLTAEEAADLADGGTVDIETMLAAEMVARAESPNLSFFAFTATPKAKTLELFGRQDADGGYVPFHLYSMQQAIEEGYILDVLRNYTSYSTAFQIAERGRRLKAVDDSTLVDTHEATRGLMRWVSLHPTNIAQKVEIIVEHYLENVQPLLHGHAKAMVVASSREHAARYKAAMDRYIAERGCRIGTLVAISGSLDEGALDADVFPAATAPFSESNMNTGLKGRSIPDAFATDDFQVLIVANKYQTGFDQPLLCGMYVDKRLSGVNAVQTLSRLNRTYAAGGKDRTYILDFVNDPEEILGAFRTYFRDAQLESATDPDLVLDLQDKLDGAHIYRREEVEAFADAFYTGAVHSAHIAPLKIAADRFNSRYEAAADAGEQDELERLDLFRHDVGAYLRAYDFLSQIVPYADVYLEKLAQYLRLLLRHLTGRTGAEPVDLSDVELIAMRQMNRGQVELSLVDEEGAPLQPMAGQGTGSTRTPEYERLTAIIERLNELFGGEFSIGRVDAFQKGIVVEIEEDPTVRGQARANSKAQFLQSPDLDRAVTNAMMDHIDTQTEMVEKAFATDAMRDAVVKAIGEIAWETIRGEQAG